MSAPTKLTVRGYEIDLPQLRDVYISCSVNASHSVRLIYLDGREKVFHCKKHKEARILGDELIAARDALPDTHTEIIVRGHTVRLLELEQLHLSSPGADNPSVRLVYKRGPGHMFSCKSHQTATTLHSKIFTAWNRGD